MIVYQDRRIVVAEKPCGVLSTDEPGGMPELLRQELGEPKGCVLTVHRLDRDVGGLMVFARSHRAAALLSEQIRNGTFQKEYLAVVHGCPEQPEGLLTDYLTRDRKTRMTLIAAGEGADAQEARLHYTVLAGHQGVTLLRIRLLTGRTHQIRAQFAHAGHPLLGDRIYGVKKADPVIEKEPARAALHAEQLCFLQPFTGERIVLRSELPEDMRKKNTVKQR